MNWMRGFVRFWVVLSALWLIAVGTISFSSWNEVESIPLKDQQDLRAMLQRHSCEGEPPDLPEGESAQEYEKKCPRLRELVQKKLAIANARERRKRAILTAGLAWGFSGPIILFGAGGAVGWVVSGFRR